MEERRTEVVVNWLPVAEVEPPDGETIVGLSEERDGSHLCKKKPVQDTFSLKCLR